jgi:ATP-dependent Lon protease
MNNLEHKMEEQNIRKIVKDEINKFVNDSLDKEIKKLLAKSGTLTRDENITIIKNALDAVYKVLWTKKEFWKSDIK